MKLLGHVQEVPLACRVIFAPVTFPISLLLDKWLGRDIGTVYSQEELKRLMSVPPSMQHAHHTRIPVIGFGTALRN